MNAYSNNEEENCNSIWNSCHLRFAVRPRSSPGISQEDDSVVLQAPVRLLPVEDPGRAAVWPPGIGAVVEAALVQVAVEAWGGGDLWTRGKKIILAPLHIQLVLFFPVFTLGRIR